jgi:hypothetical protein
MSSVAARITIPVTTAVIPVRMISQEIDREPVREHDRLAAAVRGCGEQFERPAALGLRAAPAA